LPIPEDQKQVIFCYVFSDTDLPLGIHQAVTRPGSSLTPLSGRATLKFHERLMSAKTRPIGRAKLAPILGADHYSKTPLAVRFYVVNYNISVGVIRDRLYVCNYALLVLGLDSDYYSYVVYLK
jgi:hypothetical protein